MHMQVQEENSYRSQDVVEVLGWMLPQARIPDERIIVLLDWFSGHTTEEVKNLVASKGHVLLFHGGGTIPFTQINDTHLHALLARYLIQFENQFATERATEGRAKRVKRTFSSKRERTS